ncbi:hypothetical protein BJ508DRAFT_312143 [Ascobolus immersus RN42]|uniref:DUF7514 domain-containing protein n=1 Tax=Ascobolus immersus RN42 TaxID=1160509 RepID=A0A3N4HNB6_ASCIM|nr:hypothetical protein BJ508DRAFT_312143 [Ascobolus immersus RN42]
MSYRPRTAAPTLGGYRPPPPGRYTAAPPSPAVSADDIPFHKLHISGGAPRDIPSPPSSQTSSTYDRPITFTTWPALFEVGYGPDPAASEALQTLFKALARFLVNPPLELSGLVMSGLTDCWDCKTKEIAPRDSLCICPAKMVRFYEIFGVERDECWEEFFAQDHRQLSKLFSALHCHHHYIPDSESSTPTIPALTPLGFTTWMTRQLLAFPDRESARLIKAVSMYPISFPGTSERIPPLTESDFQIYWDPSYFVDALNASIKEVLGKGVELQGRATAPPQGSGRYAPPVTVEEEADPESHGPEGPGYCPTDIVMEPVNTAAQAEIGSAALEILRERNRLEKQRAKEERERERRGEPRTERTGRREESATPTPKPARKPSNYAFNSADLPNPRESLPRLSTTNPAVTLERKRNPYAHASKANLKESIPQPQPQPRPRDRDHTSPPQSARLPRHTTWEPPHSYTNKHDLPPRSRTTVSTPTRGEFFPRPSAAASRRDSYNSQHSRGSHDAYPLATPPLTPASSSSGRGHFQMVSGFTPPVPQVPGSFGSHPHAPRGAPEGYYFPKQRVLSYGETDGFIEEPGNMSDPETDAFVEDPSYGSPVQALGRYGSGSGDGYFEDRGYGGAAVTPGPYPGGGYGSYGAPPAYGGTSGKAPSQVWSDTSARSRGSSGSQTKDEAWADY